MAKVCVEYKLHRNNEGNLKAPDWVTDGGHFMNYDDNTIIAFIPEEADRKWWVPDGLTTYDEEEFVSRGMVIHGENPFSKGRETNEDGTLSEDVPMNDVEAETFLRNYFTEKIA